LTKIAIIGDYDKNRHSHLATNEAIRHAHSILPYKFKARWIPTQPLEDSRNLQELEQYHGIWGSAGDPDSRLGLIKAIEFARIHNIPYLGT
jgi:CTP synthase (UTP-ammonia lyase)